MTPRKGIVEIETLRRYGRVRVGTRAEGSFVLAPPEGKSTWYSLTIRILIADDPRPVGPVLYFPWPAKLDDPRTWWQSHRGSSREVKARDFWDGVIQKLILMLEDESTSQGHQRFRVVRAEWLPEGQQD